jgi:hypothetical protein
MFNLQTVHKYYSNETTYVVIIKKDYLEVQIQLESKDFDTVTFKKFIDDIKSHKKTRVTVSNIQFKYEDDQDLVTIEKYPQKCSFKNCFDFEKTMISILSKEMLKSTQL